MLKDGDGHEIYDSDVALVNPPKPIVVGDNVWIGADVTLLKGAKLPNGTIVGYRSVITKAFEEKNLLLAGSPARILKQGVTWK
jgi:acetyltransferase-like isoleucine patch superfamily enzyme